MFRLDTMFELDSGRMRTLSMVSRQMQTLLRDEAFFSKGNPVDALLLRYVRFLKHSPIPSILVEARTEVARDLCRHARVYAKSAKYTDEETEARLREVMSKAEDRMRKELSAEKLATLPKEPVVPPSRRLTQPQKGRIPSDLFHSFDVAFEEWSAQVERLFPDYGMETPTHIARAGLLRFEAGIKASPAEIVKCRHIATQLVRASEQVLQRCKANPKKPFSLQDYLDKTEGLCLARLICVPYPTAQLCLPQGESKMPHP